MTAGAIDVAQLEQFMGQMVGHMTGGAVCFSIWLGDELGLYRALASDGAHTVDEIDFHAPSIETARERAREAGIGDRASFEVGGAKDYPGSYDLICFFDCLHDMGDPVGIAAYAREHLEESGTVLNLILEARP